MPKCSITQSGNDYAVKTPFSRAFVNDLKQAVSVKARHFDGESKAWIVSPEYAESLPQLIKEHFGETITLPELVKAETSQKYTFQLDYLGIPKERPGEAEKTALGLSKGDWRVVFSETVLKAWFEKSQTGKDETLFSALLISESATDQEIKSGYRRLARQWHPDINHEPEAPEMFRRIDEAYKVLIDPVRRKKYLAGLYLERSENQRRPDYFNRRLDAFIPPLRCGQLSVIGSITVGKLRVAEILKWDDVTNEQGRVMVSSWDKETQSVRIEWV